MDLLLESCNNSDMNKNILLELTEKEGDFINKDISVKREVWSKSQDSTGYENRMNLIKTCDILLAKLESASQPQKEVLIVPKDLSYLISLAKNQYKYLSSDIHISGKKVEESDFKHISLAQAVIMWLNSQNLLKREVKFNFTDNSYEYDSIEE